MSCPRYRSEEDMNGQGVKFTHCTVLLPVRTDLLPVRTDLHWRAVRQQSVVCVMTIQQSVHGYNTVTDTHVNNT